VVFSLTGSRASRLAPALRWISAPNIAQLQAGGKQMRHKIAASPLCKRGDRCRYSTSSKKR
jgi:hypothetical protein